ARLRSSSPYVGSRGLRHDRQLTPAEIDLFWATWRLGRRPKSKRLERCARSSRYPRTATGFPAPNRPSHGSSQTPAGVVECDFGSARGGLRGDDSGFAPAVHDFALVVVGLGDGNVLGPVRRVGTDL